MKTISLWLYRICAFLTPAIYMLYFYTQNVEWLDSEQVLNVSGLLCIGSLFLFWSFRTISKSHLAAFLAVTWFWAIFFGYNTFRHVLGLEKYTILSLAILIWVAIMLLVKRIKNQDTLAVLVTVMTTVQLTLNIFSLAVLETPPSRIDETLFKQEFIVDETLSMPNVYWFHCDGMLGFNGMERFFNDPQTEFTQALYDRGFSINRNANFEAGHSSSLAIPALMCPHYYDVELSFVYDPKHAFGKMGKTVPVNYIPPAPSIYSSATARERNELQIAFIERGYDLSTIDVMSIYFYPRGSRFYNVNYSYFRSELLLINPAYGDFETMRYIQNIEKTENLFRLSMPLKLTIQPFIMPFINKDFILESKAIPERLTSEKFDIPNTVDRRFRVIAQCLADSLEQTEPRFVLIGYDMPHWPFFYDENGNLNSGDVKHISLYPAHHRYSAKVLINYIDLILEKDPDALIVMQADHGLHGLTLKHIMENKNCSADEARVAWNSVISAVRVPEKFGGPLEKPLEPLNITRYLINNFVGPNYEYIKY